MLGILHKIFGKKVVDFSCPKIEETKNVTLITDEEKLIQELVEYYNERIRLMGMPDFEELTDEWKSGLQNSHGFVVWKLDKAINQLTNSITEPLARRLRTKKSHD